MMRRYGWWVVGLLLLALWAWQQRATISDGSMPSSAATTLPAADDAAATRPQRSDRTRRDDARDAGSRYPPYLPREALATLQRIERGGPHPYRQDGGTFQNRERRLPARPPGHYREYTVDTPGAGDRGARRIIAGGEPPTEFFYSDDHYRSFRGFPAARAEAGR